LLSKKRNDAWVGKREPDAMFVLVMFRRACTPMCSSKSASSSFFKSGLMCAKKREWPVVLVRFILPQADDAAPAGMPMPPYNALSSRVITRLPNRSIFPRKSHPVSQPHS